MSLRRELKSYTVILNAYQHEIDRLSSDLAGIRAAQADVESRMQHLQHRADTEGFAVSIEAAPFVAGFLDAIAAQKKALQRQLVNLNQAAADLEDQVRAKFIELQTWRVTCDRLKQQIAYDAQQKEDAELDEVARNVFILNQTS